MPNKKINELSPRTPSLSDLIIVGDPSTGYSYRATLTTMVNFVGGNIQFSSLGGVSLTSPSNGQYLTFNGTNWVNSTLSTTNWDTAYNRSLVSAGVSGTTTKTLTLTKQDGSTLTASWSDLNTDAVTSVFGRTGAVVATEGDYNLGQLGDVAITTPSSNQVLQYNGTGWVNATFVAGINSLNGLTATTQTFATGTSGTDFAISSTTSTHTFNLPTASATNRGALSSADWSTFNAKQDAITLTTTGSSGASTFVSNTLNIPTYTLAGLGGVSGSGTTNYLSKWTSSSALGNSLLTDASNTLTYEAVGGNALLIIKSPSGSYYPSLRFTGNATLNAEIYSYDRRIYTSALNGHYFTNGTTTQMLLTANGRLLIGTTTESTYELDVVGDIRSTLDANINGLTVGKGTGQLASNTAIGYQALNAASTGNGGNVAVGYQALNKVTSGEYNTVNGWQSGLNITTGSYNHLYGYRTGRNLSTAVGNVMIGYGVAEYGAGNTNYNILIGYSVAQGYFSPSLSDNLVIGRNSGNLISGGRNVLLGYNIAIFSTGSTYTDVVALGNEAGTYVGSGTTRIATLSSGIYIGYQARASADANTNETVIGYNVVGNGSNSVTLGNTSVTKTVLQSGVLVGTTTSAGYALDVNGTTRISGTELRLDNATTGTINLYSATPEIRFAAGDPTGYRLYRSATNMIWNSANITLQISGNDAYTLSSANGHIWRTALSGGAALARLDTGGSLSIGKGSTAAVASSILELSSTTKGFLPPKMTNAQMVAITTPASGLMVYDTTNNKLNVYDGTNWVAVH